MFWVTLLDMTTIVHIYLDLPRQFHFQLLLDDILTTPLISNILPHLRKLENRV